MQIHIEECEQCGKTRFGCPKGSTVDWSVWCPAHAAKFKRNDPDIVSFDTIEECPHCIEERVRLAAGSVH